MKKTLFALLITMIMVAFFACKNADRKEADQNNQDALKQDSIAKVDKGQADALADEEKNKAKGQSMSPEEKESVSSSAAIEDKKSNRKFVRTADMKFKVKNVYKASLEIEKICAKNQGFVTYTELQSTIANKVVTAISPDSSLETIYYDVENDIVLRVPNIYLDSTIRDVAKLILYLDHRIIRADDVSLLLLSNDLTQQRIQRNIQRTTNQVDQKGHRLDESMNAEENLLNKQTQLDDVKMSNLKMLDEINYSTLKINIYQRQTYRREMIENDKNIQAYDSGFFTKAKNGFLHGCHVLLALLLFFIRIWYILLIAFIILVIVRKYFWKKNKPKTD